MPRTPGTPRQPLGDLSPGARNRIIGARKYGIPYTWLAVSEKCSPSTARLTVKNALLQPGGLSRPRGRPPSTITERDARAIFRAITRTPKITAVQLRATTVPHVSMKTVYRFLKKSGIQKWRCRKRPVLTDERAAARLQWALLHDNKPLAYWRRWRWSDECSIERGKGGRWEFVYRAKGQYLHQLLPFTTNAI